MRIFIVLVFLLGNICNFSYANIIINTTRVIYNETSNEVLVQLINKGDMPALVQSWIDDGDINSTPENSDVPFLLSPPVVKVSANNGQQLQIKKTNRALLLPRDRESIFFLNVLDIPSKARNMEGINTMQLAIKSRIKFFYRPKDINSDFANAIDLLSITKEKDGIVIKNNSPYHITIANIENGLKKLLQDSVMVAPFSDSNFIINSSIVKGNEYNILYIDDYGSYKRKTFILK